MRALTFIILTAVVFSANAQTAISYEKVLSDLLNSSKCALISIYSNQLEQKSELYLIDLVNEDVLSEPPIFDAKTKKYITADIVTNSKERKLIINCLNSRGLLDSLYVRINESYTNIKSLNDNFEISEPLMVIEIMLGVESEIMQTFVKIEDINQAEGILMEIDKILGEKNQKLFNHYSENIQRLKD
ncbi:hypothetical protein [Marinifilum fragile]|uniref:hypothetical protein n=1 Tax=Marinifilum fragile TaxID=570161 RepID=UPI0006CFA5CC|nr:hypothetical protein [Marinifilum fragile]